MVGLTVLLVSIGAVLGQESGAMVALVIALSTNLFSYWFSDKIVLKMYRAKEATESEAPELYGVVRDLAMKAQMPMPKVYVIPSEAPNAFATGRNPNHAAVAATVGIMRLLDREELAGVMAHELAHVKNRDTLIGTLAASIAGAISMLAWIAVFFGGRRDDRGSPLGLLIAFFVAPVAAGLIQMAISRSREYQADATGAQICGNPLWLARALAKLDAASRRVTLEANPATAHMFIVNPLRGGGPARLFSTHPPMADRISRLEQMSRAIIG